MPSAAGARVRARLAVGQQRPAARAADGHVLIDSGYVHARAAHAGAAGARPRASAASRSRGSSTRTATPTTWAATRRVQRAYGCPIAIPAGEAPLVDAWDTKALLLDYADQQADRFARRRALAAPAATHVWGELEWQVLAAPGHDMGALVFFNPEHRILDLRRRAVGERLRLRDAARHRPAGAAGDARDARHDRRARRAGGDPRPRRAVHRRGGGARARLPPHRSRSKPTSRALARYALKVILAFTLLDRRRWRSPTCPATSSVSASSATSTRAACTCRPPNWRSCS